MNKLTLLEQAQRYLEGDDYKEAIILLEQCIETEKNKIEYYWYLGLAYFFDNEYEESENIWMSGVLEQHTLDIESLVDFLIQFIENITLKLSRLPQKAAKIINTYRLYRTILENRPEYQNQYLDRFLEQNLRFITQIIEEDLFQNNREEVIYNYQILIFIMRDQSMEKNKAELFHRITTLYVELHQYNLALESIDAAITLNSTIGKYHYVLGVILDSLEDQKNALEAYQTALRIDENLVDAYNNLGNLFRKLSQWEPAEFYYRQAIAKFPQHFGSYMNLGNTLLEQDKIDAALQIYQQALKFQGQNHQEINPDIYYNLSLAFQAKEDNIHFYLYQAEYYHHHQKYQESVEYYQQYVSLNQDVSLDVYLSLAYCYRNLEQSEQVINLYQEVIKNYPHEFTGYQCLIDYYHRLGFTEKALEWATVALNQFPNNLSLKRLNQGLLPIIYKTEADIQWWRERFCQLLDQLIEQTSEIIKIDDNTNNNQILSCLDVITNYGIHFQAKNDLEIQKKYGDLITKILHLNYPQWSEILKIPPIKKDQKIRVGYISARLGLIGHLFINWLKFCNRDQFEIYVYDLGVTQISNLNRINLFYLFKNYSDFYYFSVSNVETIAKKIYDDQLHILTYLDIGTEPLITKLSSLRLAPVQCAAWGHPITSGLPTIDYFLGSDAMEPPNTQEHYSEKLIRLPNLGIYLSTPMIPTITKNREYFNLTPQGIIYLCCQMLIKYLPQYDYIFPVIAQQVPDAKFVFFKTSEVGNQDIIKFYNRLKKAFDQWNLNIDDFWITLPKLEFDDYLHVHLLSDVFLDTFGWSGGVTSLDAIACDLPIVTCPGELMRGRQSYGMLKIIGVTETIANNETEYINIAVRLGLDQAWRQSVKIKMQNNRNCLYNDYSCIEALENFYQKFIKNKDNYDHS